ncbi:hypothetical protein EYF80_029424 [Liparis tanakae]|uniref:Uncharacterized protein n=1 Tax=Liparis tanakae TaxID=230148 RepID=A0A4Z2H5N1_9TELE|nr:hypothetical protein EYF80_029424 [Liparis tanakae]
MVPRVEHGATLDQLSRRCSPQLYARPAGTGQMRTLTLLQCAATWVSLSDLSAFGIIFAKTIAIKLDVTSACGMCPVFSCQSEARVSGRSVAGAVWIRG